MLAVSRAGHDRGKTYVVIHEDPPYVLLVNGSTRPLAKPKRKKVMHVQLVRHLPDELAETLQQIRDDSDVRRVLALYRKSHQTEEEKTDR